MHVMHAWCADVRDTFEPANVLINVMSGLKLIQYRFFGLLFAKYVH